MEASSGRSACGYIRVSSRAQDHASQRAAIERAAAARGDSITRWYAETASAKTVVRPELQRLRADARAGIVPRLYVFRLDRLTRSGVRDTFELVEYFRHHGVEIITISDGFDLNGPAAEIVLAVMAGAAKMERIAINERIAAARERCALEGRPWGRPTRMDAVTLRRAHTMRVEGRSVRAIAIALKVPRSTIARALASQKHPVAKP
jgi:DNA invertase Pin-like site-specific DNA recombinase